MRTALILLLVVLGGCAGAEKTGCALQAFAAGVRGAPEPDCIAQVRALESGRLPPAPAPVMHCWRDLGGQNMYCQLR